MNNESLSEAWWSMPQETVLQQLHVDAQAGLSEAQVNKYRTAFGSNNISTIKPKSFVTLCIEGIKEPMMLVLLSIAALSLMFGKIGQAFTMIFVVAAYISVELLNKYRADRTLVRLRGLTRPTAKVIRAGSTQEIQTEELVVGDIIIVSEGVLVPADARIITAHGLLLNEASLTGESLPKQKNAAAVDATTLAAERTNTIFSGTMVVSGEGTAVIVAVGAQSEFGKIAKRVQTVQKEQTVLQASMTKLAKILALFAICTSALIPAIGYLRGLGFEQMVLTWLSLTFLMIPGQPPIIITMALALAAFSLARQKIIVKRLRGVEILGQVTCILSDKTGTITESSMRLETFYTSHGAAERVTHDLQDAVAHALPDYCTDPTDIAVAAALPARTKQYTQIGFYGFSDTKPWRDLVYKKNGTLLHAIAGNPELILAHATVSSEQKTALLEQVQQHAQQGKRITAYATLENSTLELKNLTHLTFHALAVLHDPVRPGVKDAIATLEQAGITTCIVTGDYAATAQAIATEVGIRGNVLTGEQLSRMTDSELQKQMRASTIFARIDPSQKMRLVTTLQQRGDIVAVIGDGINDAPALKAAQVGIAMGQIGTDLAKEVADLIITDDAYTHIPDAVAISRKALDNFKKGLSYYISAKVILLIVFLIPLVLGIPFPFAPMHIIFIELLMDLASSTIFVTEQAEPELMHGAQQPVLNFLGKPLIAAIMKYATPLACGIMIIYVRTYQQYDITTAQTAAFIAWLIGHILLALNLKQRQLPLCKQGLLANTVGFMWLAGMIALSVIITSVPALYPYVATTQLPLALWLEIGTIVCAATLWIEAGKLIRSFTTSV